MVITKEFMKILFAFLFCSNIYASSVKLTLLDNVVYKHGSPQKTLQFKLEEDTVIKKINFKKGNILYGTVSKANEYSHIVDFELNIDPSLTLSSNLNGKKQKGIKANYIEKHEHFIIENNVVFDLELPNSLAKKP